MSVSPVDYVLREYRLLIFKKKHLFKIYHDLNWFLHDVSDSIHVSFHHDLKRSHGRSEVSFSANQE